MEIEAQARMEEFLVSCCVRSSDDMTERIKFNGILASCKDYRVFYPIYLYGEANILAPE